MAENEKLLIGLREYRTSLSRHISRLSENYENLSREWQRLEYVYQGDAAEEFKALWMTTGHNFQEYIERGQRILKVLDERITYLQQASNNNIG